MALARPQKPVPGVDASYLMEYPHTYPPAWPGTAAGQIVLGQMAGTTSISQQPGQPSVPGQPPAQVVTIPVLQMPPSALLFFRGIPGTTAVQIQTSSWRSRKIVIFAPTYNLASIFMGTQGVGAYGYTSFEIPPGGVAVVEISDVSVLFFVGLNNTDIITGWAESLL